MSYTLLCIVNYFSSIKKKETLTLSGKWMRLKVNQIKIKPFSETLFAFTRLWFLYFIYKIICEGAKEKAQTLTAISRRPESSAQASHQAARSHLRPSDSVF